MVEIEDAAFDTDLLSRRAFRARMASKAAALVVAELDARVVGHALVEFRRTSQRARLFSIARGADAPKGSGRALLQACEAEALRRGCIAMRLESREDNVRALRLYESAGYVRFARVEHYYADGAPAVRLEKALQAG